MNQLKVESIKAGEFIANYSNDIMELGGETDKNGNTASYSFTFLGQKEGIKGSCTLAIITAQVVNDDNLSITQDNMKVKLVKKVGNSVEDYSFKFKGYNISEILTIVCNNHMIYSTCLIFIYGISAIIALVNNFSSTLILKDSLKLTLILIFFDLAINLYGSMFF